MLLPDKIAVLYGASGNVGRAVARAFAREGATVFLTARNRSAVDALARALVSEGGKAEAAEVDALDEQAIERHLDSVVGKAGRLDVSFNRNRDPASRDPGSAADRTAGRELPASNFPLRSLEFPDCPGRGAPHGRKAVRGDPDAHAGAGAWGPRWSVEWDRPGRRWRH